MWINGISGETFEWMRMMLMYGEPTRVPVRTDTQSKTIRKQKMNRKHVDFVDDLRNATAASSGYGPRTWGMV